MFGKRTAAVRDMASTDERVTKFIAEFCKGSGDLDGVKVTGAYETQANFRIELDLNGTWQTFADVQALGPQIAALYGARLEDVAVGGEAGVNYCGVTVNKTR